MFEQLSQKLYICLCVCVWGGGWESGYVKQRNLCCIISWGKNSEWWGAWTSEWQLCFRLEHSPDPADCRAPFAFPDLNIIGLHHSNWQGATCQLDSSRKKRRREIFTAGPLTFMGKNNIINLYKMLLFTAYKVNAAFLPTWCFVKAECKHATFTLFFLYSSEIV